MFVTNLTTFPSTTQIFIYSKIIFSIYVSHIFVTLFILFYIGQFLYMCIFFWSNVYSSIFQLQDRRLVCKRLKGYLETTLPCISTITNEAIIKKKFFINIFDSFDYLKSRRWKTNMCSCVSQNMCNKTYLGAVQDEYSLF